MRTWRSDPEALELLLDGPRSAWRVVACFVLIVAAAMVTFVRWHLLLRTLHIPIRLRDTMRLGFFGQLLNFVSLGQVGGDLFKAFFIAKEQKGRRSEAVGTIIVDRVCGLYGLLIVATVALLVSRAAELSPQVAIIANVTYVFTIVCTIGAILVLTPAIARSAWIRKLTEIPRIGPAFHRLLNAIYLFQNNRVQLLFIGVLSLLVHILIAFGVYFAATGLYAETPSMADIFVASPLACVVGALPISPGGLGTYEVAMDYLYDLFSPPDKQGRGIVVASCYRIGTICVAVIGIVFYWMRHRELARILHQAESEADRESSDEPQKSAPLSSSATAG